MKNIESIRKIIFETQDTPISAQDVINLLNQRISDLNDANKEQAFIKSPLKDKLLWITNGFANPSNKTINTNATFPDSVSCYAFVKDTSFALRIRFSNHYNKKVRHNIRARQAQASTQATEIISFVFDSNPDKVDVRQPIDGIPFSIININERHLSKKDDVILYIKSLIDLIKSQKYKMPFVAKATYKTEHKKDKYSICDYINEQKYQTTYKMKSLNSYITESQAKPNKNGEYEFWAQASVIVGDHFCVKADSFEEAAKKATEIANKKIDDIPMKIGEVVEGMLGWNDGIRYIQ